MNLSIEQIINDLIAIRSIESDMEMKNIVLDYIAKYFDGYKQISLKKFQIHDSPALFLSKEGTTFFNAIFTTHLNVTDGLETQFHAQIRDYKVYGRGAADAKGVAAVLMKLYETLVTFKKQDHIGILFTTGGNEIRDIKEILLQTNMTTNCIIATNSESLLNHQIISEQLASLHVKLNAHGISGHGSTPWKGKNAIEMILEDISALQNDIINSPTNEIKSFNVGHITGGSSVNSIPDHAEASIAFSLQPGIATTNLKQNIEHIVKHSTVQYVVEKESFVTSIQNKYMQKMKQFMEEAFLIDIPIIRETITETDESLSQDTPIFLCSPLGYGAGTNEEWVSLPSLHQYLDIYILFCESIPNHIIQRTYEHVTRTASI